MRRENLRDCFKRIAENSRRELKLDSILKRQSTGKPVYEFGQGLSDKETKELVNEVRP